MKALKNRSILRTTAALLLTMAMAGSLQASEKAGVVHQYLMRGHIIEASDEGVVLCIGSADGAQVGQELTVIRHRRISTGPKGMGRFERDEVGVVQIEALVDGHYAEARVISGEALAHDTVELSEP